jgi:hypothetical protein
MYDHALGRGLQVEIISNHDNNQNLRSEMIINIFLLLLLNDGLRARE